MQSPIASPMLRRYFVCPRPNSDAQLRLFCLPYAGGGASVFRSWPQHLPEYIEMCAIEIPGRGMRMTETLETNALKLSAGLADIIEPLLDKPFAF